MLVAISGRYKRDAVKLEGIYVHMLLEKGKGNWYNGPPLFVKWPTISYHLHNEHTI